MKDICMIQFTWRWKGQTSLQNLLVCQILLMVKTPECVVTEPLKPIVMTINPTKPTMVISTMHSGKLRAARCPEVLEARERMQPPRCLTRTHTLREMVCQAINCPLPNPLLDVLQIPVIQDLSNQFGNIIQLVPHLLLVMAVPIQVPRLVVPHTLGHSHDPSHQRGLHSLDAPMAPMQDTSWQDALLVPSNKVQSETTLSLGIRTNKQSSHHILCQ